jgi:hypothetical protein
MSSLPKKRSLAVWHMMSDADRRTPGLRRPAIDSRWQGDDMKHAGAVALATIEPLLTEIRKVDALVEKRPGVFYRKSVAFLHFHEDPAGIFADVRIDSDWQRLPVNTAAERRRLVKMARAQDGKSAR